MRKLTRLLSITLSIIVVGAGFYVVLSELTVNTTVALYVFKMLGIFGIFAGFYACCKTLDETV